MENVTLGQVVASLGLIGTLAGFFITVYKLLKKVVLDKIENNTKDIKALEKRMETVENEIKEGKEERLILLKGQLACLKGLKERFKRTRM